MDSIGCTGSVQDDGRWVGEVVTEPHLVGPPGIVQGGIASALALVAARTAVPGAPPVTSIESRLHLPTPAGVPVTVVAEREGVGRHHVEVRAGDRTTATSTVVLAGHEDTPRAADLVALASGPLPAPEPQAVFGDCWVCGEDNPRGLRLAPAFARPDVVLQSW